MHQVPLIHRSALTPAIAILDGIGAPTGSLLRRHRLPTLDYELASGFLPTLSTWGFVESAAESQRIWDLGFRIAERVTVQRAFRRWTGVSPREYRRNLTPP